MKNMPKAELLYNAGYKTIDEVKSAGDDDLMKLKGIGDFSLKKIRKFLKDN